MKYINILAAGVALFCINAFAAPAPLAGLWQAGDRYVLFDPQSEDTAIVLRLYDKWYDDRTAEPLSYKENTPRTRNSATATEAEHIIAKTSELASNAAWEINARYGKRADDETIIPVAVIGDEMYLDFAIKTGDEPFYQGVRSQSAIRSCPMPSNGEVSSYYIADNAVYRLRYWPIDLMGQEKSGRMATFTDEGKVYTVPAQIVSLGRVFTCVTGRSVKIRNIERLPPSYLDGKRSEDGTVIALGAPAMTRLAPASAVQGASGDAMDTEEYKKMIFGIVSQANRRRCPPPKPLLPPSSVDWHMDLINSLEQGNLVIAAVRERSRQFAASGALAGREDATGAMAENSRLVPDW